MGIRRRIENRKRLGWSVVCGLATFTGWTQPAIERWVAIGEGSHEGNAITVDSSGAVYLTGQYNPGRFEDGLLISEIGGVEAINRGRTDFFLVKYDAQLEPVWTRVTGSDKWDYGTAIALLGDDRVVVAGAYQAAINLEGVDLPYSGQFDRADSFIAGFDAEEGALDWVVTINGEEDTIVDSLAVGPDGSIYASGRIRHLAEFGEFTIGQRFQSRAFLSKLTPDGVFEWAREVAPTAGSGFVSVTTDAAGTCYVGGSLFDSTRGVFTAAYDPDGQSLWRRDYAGDGGDEISAIHIGPDQSLYINGRYSGASLDLGERILENTTGFFSGFAAKFDASGTLQWAMNQGARAYGSVLDESGALAFVGYFDDTAAGFGETEVSSAGGLDAYIAQISANGAMDWVVPLGKDATELSRTIARAPSGAFALAGEGLSAVTDDTTLKGTVWVALTGSETETGPQLTIRWEDGAITLSWDAEEAYEIEASEGLGGPFSNETFTGTADPELPNTFHMIPAETKSQFFRLKKVE